LPGDRSGVLPDATQIDLYLHIFGLHPRCIIPAFA
jgi:hypothetical protein